MMKKKVAAWIMIFAIVAGTPGSAYGDTISQEEKGRGYVKPKIEIHMKKGQRIIKIFL